MGARIGVIGLGRIGSYHARNLLTTDGVDALVVTDVDARRTSDVASELDVESAADPDALLASGIDGVLIAASSSSHADLIEAAVRRDIPTFCEKPVADSIESRDCRADVGTSPDRISAPIRPVICGGVRRSSIWRTRLDPHSPIDHPRPRSPADLVHRTLRRHLPRLLDPRFRHRQVGQRPRSHHGFCHRLESG